MTRLYGCYKIIPIFLGALLSILISTPVKAVVEVGGDLIKMDTTPAIPENFIFTGSATYKIPIEVPPGRLGMAPNIELSYNSYQRNGWLGVGWSLDMGSIRRNTKAGLDYGRDDFVFTKDGSNTELIKVDAAAGEYRAKIEDGSLLRFYYNGTSWTVNDKDGKVYTYGQTSSTRQGSTLGTFKWCLDRVEDSNGNYMTINYQQDQGEIYLSQINYTGNSKSAINPTNTIDFIRELRTDAPVSYFSHAPVKTAYRLKTILIKAGVENVRKYELSYDANSTEHYSLSTHRSLLSKIEKYGIDNAQWTKWPQDTTFTWNQDQPQYDGVDHAFSTTPRVGNYGTQGMLRMADVNGDGFTDIVYEDGNRNYHVLFSTGNGFTADTANGLIQRLKSYNPDYKGFRLADVDGDGKADIIYDDNNNNFHVIFSTGYGFEPDTADGLVKHVNNISTYIGSHGAGQLGGWTVGDFNGDGKADLYYIDLVQNQFGGHILLSKGRDFTDDTKSGCTFGGTVLPLDKFSDLNNDGKTDILYGEFYYNGNSSDEYYAYLSTGETTTCFSTWLDWGARLHNVNSVAELTDVNGDGLPDFVYEDTNRNIRVLLNTGSGFTNDDDTAIWGSRDMRYSDGSGGPQLADFNGDGLADFAYEHQRTTYVKLSTGTGFLAEQVWGTRTSGYNDSNHGLRITDINGDGLVDLLYEGNNQVMHGLVSKGPFPDLIKTINDFKGATYSIVYKPSSYYFYQNTLMPFIVQTVESITITTTDGVSNTALTTNYDYALGYYDFEDREFRGFGYVKQINPDNTTLETWFHQKDVKDVNGNYTDDEDYKGKPYHTELKNSAGVLLSRTDIGFERTTIKGSSNPYPVFVKMTEKTTKDYFDGTTETFKRIATTYNNDNGNLERIDASGTGAEDVTTVNHYWQSPDKWLWRPDSTTITGSSDGLIVRKTTFDYEPGTGNLLSTKYWLDDGTNPTTTFTYKTEGNLWQQWDAKLNLTTIEYDITNTYPHIITYPSTENSSHAVEQNYDYRFGTPKETKDENGNWTYYVYDPFGRVKQADSPDGGQTAIDYFDNFLPAYSLTKIKETSGTTIKKYDFFDQLGRNIQTITFGEGSANIVTQTHYDNMGRADLLKGPFFNTAFPPVYLPAEYAEAFPCATTYPCTKTSYDAFGKPITIESTDSTYGTVSSSIVYSGLSTIVADPDNKSIEETKDYLGRTILVTEYADGGTQQLTTYNYNAAGDLQTVTNNSGNKTVIKTDLIGRKKVMNDPDMGLWQYCYDKNGNLTKQIDADGNIINFDYDALNRVLHKTYAKTTPPTPIIDPQSVPDNPNCSITGSPSGPENHDVTYTYDIGTNGKGNLFQTTNSVVTTTYGPFDTMGRVKGESKSISGDLVVYTTQYDYDLSGKLKKIYYPSNSPLGYVQYDYYPGTGLLYQVTVDGSIYATNSNYISSGAARQIDFNNGTSTEYAYDPKSTQLTGIRASKNSVDIINRVYQFTKATDIQSITDNKAAVPYTYSYDNLHRLRTEKINNIQSIGYDYSAIGNIKTKTEGTATFTYAYDPNKIHTLNNVVVTGQANPAYKQRNVLYNADLMPYQVNAVKADNTSQTIDLLYDADNMRAKKTSPSGTTYYIGGHLEKINDELVAYVFAGDLRIARVTATNKYFYHKDHLGSTLAMTDAAGIVVETIGYTPYGEEREHTGSTVTNYRFTDQEYDPETGLYNYVARLYDPVIGRFVSADSIVPDPFNPQSLNRYSYVLNNPLIYIDPTGNEVLSIVNGGYSSDWSGWTMSGNTASYSGGSWDAYVSVGFGSSGSYGSSWGGNFTSSQGDNWNNNSASQNSGWFAGLKNYLDDSAYQKMMEGHDAAAFINVLGSAAVDVFLPQEPKDLPWLFLGEMKALKYGHKFSELREVIRAWDKASFPTVAKSLRYHYGAHGTGQGILNFTREAKELLNANKALATPKLLATGEMGIKIKTKTHFGIYTDKGKIITYGPR